MDEVRQLFKRIEEEQGGRLDILVNNAYSAVPVNKTELEIVQICKSLQKLSINLRRSWKEWARSSGKPSPSSGTQ
jgi:NAD(P)-dependent dehydrogenase (short-subunit alcohol dehydrogenase family)